jgi:nucleotide-binding universal stress UspA family protein
MKKDSYTILVPIDGASITSSVLDVAVKEARDRNGTVRLLHVREPGEVAVIPGLVPLGVIKPSLPDSHCDQILRQASEYLARYKIPTLLERREGLPRAEIIDSARVNHADLIVLGCHGHSLMGRFFTGCLSSYVADHAPCPVHIAHLNDRGVHLTRPE